MTSSDPSPHERPSERWARRILRIPPLVTVAAVVAASIALSLAISAVSVLPAIGLPMRLEPVLWIAVLVPLLVATPVAALIVWLLHELARSRETATRLANHDSLTGALSRRHFSELAAREQLLAARLARPMAMLMIDVDHFKAVNDRHGHAVGDAVLANVAAQCIGTLRTTDLLARWGGEEFVALLPATDAAGALDAATRLLEAIAGSVLPQLAPHRVTASIGIAVGTEPIDHLVAQADAAMYLAKRAGRNCVRAATAATATTA